LTELSPIPTDRNANWEWRDWFERHHQDLNTRLEMRTSVLKRLLAEHNPPVVVSYGWSAADQFRELLGLTAWHIVIEEPKRVGKSSDSRCLMLPFFNSRQMRLDIIDKLKRLSLIGSQRKDPPQN
jgi:hypothetical protein